MAIIIEETENVTVRREIYAASIRIRSNPVDMGAGSVELDLMELEYHNDTFHRMTPISTTGETVADFAARSFVVGEKTITGFEVALLIKQYVDVVYAESIAPPPAEPETPTP